MYTTTTNPEQPMQAQQVTPRAAASFIAGAFKDISFTHRFAEVYNAQPKRDANPFRVFQALTGCQIHFEDAREFIQLLVECLNYNGLKLKYPLYIPDGGLNLSITAAPNRKPKDVKPARTFAALAKLAGTDALNTQVQCLHLEESVVMVTDKHKLLTVECTHGTRYEIEQDARELFERSSLGSISRGLLMEDLKAIQDTNKDLLSNTQHTVMINASTGEVTDDKPLQWRNIMPSTNATHERTDTAKALMNFALRAMDKARNLEKNTVRTLAFNGPDGYTVYVDAKLLLEIANALCELQCKWTHLTFEQRDGSNPAIRIGSMTGDGMTVRGLLMPIANTGGEGKPQLLAETLAIFKR